MMFDACLYSQTQLKKKNLGKQIRYGVVVLWHKNSSGDSDVTPLLHEGKYPVECILN